MHAPESHRRRWSTVAGWAATAIVASTAVALAALAMSPALGYTTMIVTGGSMEPSIAVGSLVLLDDVDPERIAAGDVITYHGYGAAGATTHRVVAPVTVGGELHFQTKGDANDTPDADLAPAAGVVGEVRASVPYAGRILAPLTGRGGAVVVAAIGAWMAQGYARALIAGVRQTVAPGALRPARRLAAVVLLAATAQLVAAPSSGAVLGDTVQVGQNTFATGQW